MYYVSGYSEETDKWILSNTDKLVELDVVLCCADELKSRVDVYGVCDGVIIPLAYMGKIGSKKIKNSDFIYMGLEWSEKTVENIYIQKSDMGVIHYSAFYSDVKRDDLPQYTGIKTPQAAALEDRGFKVFKSWENHITPIERDLEKKGVYYTVHSDRECKMWLEEFFYLDSEVLNNVRIENDRIIINAINGVWAYDKNSYYSWKKQCGWDSDTQKAALLLGGVGYGNVINGALVSVTAGRTGKVIIPDDCVKIKKDALARCLLDELQVGNGLKGCERYIFGRFKLNCPINMIVFHFRLTFRIFCGKI